jgi:hypothetical protein
MLFNVKKFNSRTARIEAQRCNLKLYQISSSRKDNKIIVNDVRKTCKLKRGSKYRRKYKRKRRRNTIKNLEKRLTPESMRFLKGYTITLIIQPITINKERKILLTNKNLTLLQKWWKHKIPELERGMPINNLEIKLVKYNTNYLLKVVFNINTINSSAIDIALENICDPDDNADYPIYLDNKGNISLEKRDNMYASFIKGKLLNQNLKEIR